MKNFPRFFIVFTLLLIPLVPSLRAQSLQTTLPLQDLAIDEDIGKVDERFTGRLAKQASLADSQAGTSERTIIQIQDVHAHYIAQENIASILERLSSVFGIEKVALEGAWVQTTLPKSRAIPTSREKQLLARTLMEDDLISGPVYATLLSPSPLALLGIEDPELYEKNRDLFLEHLPKKELIEKKLETYGEQLETLQQKTWGPELLKFGKAFGKFRETLHFEDFFLVLLKTAKKYSVDFSDLDQIVLVRKMMLLEQELTKEKLKEEIKRLLREYKDTPWNLEELIRGGKIPPEKMGFYPRLVKLSELYKMQDEVTLRDLIDQIEILVGHVLDKIIKTDKAERLWDKSERFYLAKRILLLEAAPRDLEEAGKQKEDLGAEMWAAGLGEEWNLSLEFYDLAQKRDKIFFEKLMNDPEFSGSVAIVTGGFHTAGLSDQFRDAGISYITVTPDLGEEMPDKKLYIKRMAGKDSKQDGGKQKAEESASLRAKRSNPASEIAAVAPLPRNDVKEQTLSELQNSIEWTDDQFVKAYDILLKTRNVRKAVDSFSGAAVPVSPAERVTYLVAQGKVRQSPSKDLITTSEIRVSEFMEKPRAEQRKLVLDWLAEAPASPVSAMLVSSVSIVKQMLEEENVPKLVERIGRSGDVLVLLQDVPPERIPELLWGPQGMTGPHTTELLRAPDLDALIQGGRRFKKLAKKHPFAVMKNDYKSKRYIVLPEHPASLVVYRIVTLNPNLYEAARNPRFLFLLQSLVTEILSQEVSEKAA